MFLGLLLIFWVLIRFTFLLMFFGLDKIYLCDFSKYWSTDLPNFLAVMIFSIVLLKIVDTLTAPFYQEVWHGRSAIIRTRWINGHALEYLLIETPQYAENGSLDDILFTPARRSRAFKIAAMRCPLPRPPDHSDGAGSGRRWGILLASQSQMSLMASFSNRQVQRHPPVQNSICPILISSI